MKLKNKIALVTGAAAGMGEAIAQLFAREGAFVIAADKNEKGVFAVAEKIRKAGGNAHGTIVDMADADSVTQLVRFSLEKFGTVDLLINNAGIMDNFTPLHELTDELWTQVMGVNVEGPMRLTRAVLPLFMEKKSGSIVNVSSIGGLNGSRAGLAYTASKHALLGMTKNIAYQYADYGIRCNAIAPGAVNTSINETLKDPNPFGIQKAMAGVNVNLRSGESEEIATIALFLASSDSSFVNGSVLVADGGWTAY